MILNCLLASIMFCSIAVQDEAEPNAVSDKYITIPVAKVPASFPVNFALFTEDEKQFVAFYDSEHQMTLACRRLNEAAWDYEWLDLKVGKCETAFIHVY